MQDFGKLLGLEHSLSEQKLAYHELGALNTSLIEEKFDCFKRDKNKQEKPLDRYQKFYDGIKRSIPKGWEQYTDYVVWLIEKMEEFEEGGEFKI
jgi:hypothetical protein